MGSPITFSGFNNIDFNLILESVMKQARGPLTAIENRQAGFKAQLTSLGKLTSQTNTLRQAADDLADSTAGDTVTAATTDASAVGVSSGSGAVAGRYDVVVQQLARAQTTAAATTLPDTNTTVAATGGTLDIGGVTVTVPGSVTLQELAATINGTADIGVNASVVQSGSGAYRLVLTGKETGADESFSITNSLTGSTLTFGANAVEATDATILVNNVQAISKTNTFDSAVPGVTLTVLKADPVETIGINVTSSPAALKTRLEAFVKSFNDVIGFFNDQQTAQAKGDAGSLARDPMARQIRTQLRSSLTAAYGTGDLERLSQIGVEFTLTGTLKLNSTTFEKALTDNADGVMALLSGDDGAFAGVVSTLEAYTNTDGLLKSSRDRLTVQIRAMDTQLFQAQDRLAVQRATLQQEFIAAEIAMSRLNAQSSALAGVGGS
jgi:flagellar hook-associated protein 2